MEGRGDSHHLGDVLVHLPEALQDSGHEVDSRVTGRGGRRGVQVLRERLEVRLTGFLLNVPEPH